MTAKPKPRTLDDVILHPEPMEMLVQLKCTQCNCVNPYWKDSKELERIMEKGYGLHRRDNCVKSSCHCHTGAYKPAKILRREVTLEVAFGVENG